MRSLESTYLEEHGNPNLRYTALGASLSGQLLGKLEQIEDLNGHVLSKMRGKILGYNPSQAKKPHKYLDWLVCLS